MALVFQLDVFQNNVFQTGGGVFVPPPRKTGAGSVAAGRKRRRVVVEIDGETFAVRSVEEAEALLTTARQQAEAVAPRVAKTALNKARDVERKTGTLPTLEIAVPEIKVESGGDADIAEQVKAAQREIDEIYLKAAQAAELAWLARRAYYEQDEEDVATLLLLH